AIDLVVPKSSITQLEQLFTLAGGELSLTPADVFQEVALPLCPVDIGKFGQVLGGRACAGCILLKCMDFPVVRHRWQPVETGCRTRGRSCAGLADSVGGRGRGARVVPGPLPPSIRSGSPRCCGRGVGAALGHLSPWRCGRREDRTDTRPDLGQTSPDLARAAPAA